MKYCSQEMQPPETRVASRSKERSELAKALRTALVQRISAWGHDHLTQQVGSSSLSGRAKQLQDFAAETELTVTVVPEIFPVTVTFWPAYLSSSFVSPFRV